MASLDILCFNTFNLKNKIMKIEHTKIFRGPSQILKNISWPINICIKYLHGPHKIPLATPPTYLMYGPLWANFIKLFNHLVTFTSLHIPYYFRLPSSVSLLLNIWKHLLFSGSSSAETLLWQKQLIPAPFCLKSISLLLIPQHYFTSQPFHHECLLLAKKLASQKQAIVFDENVFATPHQVT